MGCCATLPAAELLEKEIHYEQQVYRIQLAAPSHCYCLLLSKATFLDLRPKEAFNSGHICGSWWLREPSDKALKELCDLRRVALVGDDLQVAKLLRRLPQVARPAQLFLVDFKAFQGRFGFCLADQLPTLPALLLDGSPRWPAVYLGPAECLETPEARRHLKLRRLVSTPEPSDELAGAAACRAAAKEVMKSRAPCLVTGPWAAVTALLCVHRALEKRSCEELCLYLKERCALSLCSAQLSGLQLALRPRSAEALRLRRQLQQKDGHVAALRTVQTVLEKVLAQPREQRLRRLRRTNLRVAHELLAHPEAVALLLLAGWEQVSGDLVLRSEELAPLREVLQSL